MTLDGAGPPGRARGEEGQRVSRRWAVVAAGAVGIAVGAALVAPAIALTREPKPVVQPIFSCVAKSDGAIRIVTADDTCTTFESRLVWNQRGIPGKQGRPGPRGARGATGAQGPQGYQGPAGPTGPIGPQGLPGDVGQVGPVGPRGPSDGYYVATDDTVADVAQSVASLTLPVGAYVLDFAGFLELEESGGMFDSASCGIDAPGSARVSLPIDRAVPLDLTGAVDIVTEGQQVSVRCVKAESGSFRVAGTFTAVHVETLHSQ